MWWKCAFMVLFHIHLSSFSRIKCRKRNNLSLAEMCKYMSYHLITDHKIIYSIFCSDNVKHFKYEICVPLYRSAVHTILPGLILELKRVHRKVWESCCAGKWSQLLPSITSATKTRNNVLFIRLLISIYKTQEKLHSKLNSRQTVK